MSAETTGRVASARRMRRSDGFFLNSSISRSVMNGSPDGKVSQQSPDRSNQNSARPLQRQKQSTELKQVDLVSKCLTSLVTEDEVKRNAYHYGTIRVLLSELGWNVKNRVEQVLHHVIQRLIMGGKPAITKEELQSTFPYWRYWFSQFLRADSSEKSLEDSFTSAVRVGGADDLDALLAKRICQTHHAHLISFDATERPWILIFTGGANELDRVRILNHLDEIDISPFEEYVVLRPADFTSAERFWEISFALIEKKLNVVILHMDETKLEHLQSLGRVAVIDCGGVAATADEEDDLNTIRLSRLRSRIHNRFLIDLVVMAQVNEQQDPRILSVLSNLPFNDSEGAGYWHRGFGRILSEHSLHGGTSGDRSTNRLFETRFIYETPLGRSGQIDIQLEHHETTTVVAAQQSLYRWNQRNYIWLTVHDGTTNDSLTTTNDVRIIRKCFTDKQLPVEFIVQEKNELVFQIDSFADNCPLVWFFACHGTVKDDQGRDFFLQLKGTYVESRTIVELCAEAARNGRLQLVMLNCCYGGKSLAEDLKRKAGVPYVVYWEEEFLDDVSGAILERFFTTFTNSIIKGGDVHEAITESFREVRHDDLFTEYHLHPETSFAQPRRPMYAFHLRHVDCVVPLNVQSVLAISNQASLLSLSNKELVIALQSPASPDCRPKFLFDPSREGDTKELTSWIERGCVGELRLAKPIGELKLLSLDDLRRTQGLLPRRQATIRKSTREEEELGTLTLSPIMPLSLTHPSRERALIPPGACFYAFCHCPDKALAMKLKELYSEDEEDWLRIFLSSGGFMYFGEDEQTICQVNVVSREKGPGKHGILSFSAPQQLRYDLAQKLLRENRVVPVGDDGLYYGWITPREAIVPGAPVFDHGAFAIVHPSDLLQCQIHPVVRSA